VVGGGGDLVDPVGIEDTQAPQLPSSALLGNALQVALGLQLGDTLVHGLAVNDSLQKRTIKEA
jgi:hypothetical protein